MVQVADYIAEAERVLAKSGLKYKVRISISQHQHGESHTLLHLSGGFLEHSSSTCHSVYMHPNYSGSPAPSGYGTNVGQSPPRPAVLHIRSGDILTSMSTCAASPQKARGQR